MIVDNNCSFVTTNEFLNSMSDADAKEYVESAETDYWVDEYKNNL